MSHVAEALEAPGKACATGAIGLGILLGIVPDSLRLRTSLLLLRCTGLRLLLPRTVVQLPKSPVSESIWETTKGKRSRRWKLSPKYKKAQNFAHN